MERSVHDALCVVKRVLESQEVVAGGGSVEAALSIFLDTLATSIVSSVLYIQHQFPTTPSSELQNKLSLDE